MFTIQSKYVNGPPEDKELFGIWYDPGEEWESFEEAVSYVKFNLVEGWINYSKGNSGYFHQINYTEWVLHQSNGDESKYWVVRFLKEDRTPHVYISPWKIGLCSQ